MKKTEILKEVQQILDQWPEYIPKPDFNLQEYIGTQMPLKGVKTALVQDASKNITTFNALPIYEQLDCWDIVWDETPWFEGRSMCLYFVLRNKKKLIDFAHFQKISSWIRHVDNWAHSDGLSGYMATVCEFHPEWVLPLFNKWNQSKNPWERRQSVVGLMLYQKQRKNIPSFDTMIPLALNLLQDKDVFVQKGIGWFFRECYQRYPKEMLALLYEIYPDITGIAWQATSEKLEQKDKEELKRLRKAYRQKRKA